MSSPPVPALICALVEALRPLVAEVVGDAVRAHVAGAVADGVRRALQKEFLTGAEVCEWTGWSPRKLAYLKADRSIPYVQHGRSVLYPREAVEAFLKEGYVPAKWTDRAGRG